jgi:MFS family permease
VVSRGIEGAALVFITVAGAAFIRDSAPPERIGTCIGIWSIWFALGSFLAGVVSPTIYNSFGFEALWLSYAALAVVSALAIRFIVKAPNIVHAQVLTTGGKPRYRELLTRNVVLFMLVFAVYNVMVIAVVSYLPTILQGKGYDETTSGLISTVPVFLSIGGAPLLGILSDRLKRVKPLLACSMAVMALASPAMLLLTGWELWAVAVFCGIFGNSGAGVVMLGLLAVLPRPQLVAIALGVFSTMQALGMTLGNFLVPLLLGPGQTNLAFTAAVLVCIGLAGFVMSVLCRYR